jgi:uncharacterized protein (DUF305 family)
MSTSPRIVRHLSVSLLGLTLIGGLLQSAGCASGIDSSRPAATGRQPVAVAESADARFIAAAERSSAWAIHMSELVIANGEIKDVRATAQKIKDRETVNLQLLAKERARLGLPAAVSDHHADPHMDQDETRLAALKGEDADMLYAEHMLEQRRDIIALANFARPELSSAALAQYAQSLPQERYKDVGELINARSHAHPVPANSRAALGIKTGPAATTTPPRR